MPDSRRPSGSEKNILSSAVNGFGVCGGAPRGTRSRERGKTMKDDRKHTGNTPAAAAVHKRAEELLRSVGFASLPAQTAEEVRQVIHELLARQIELEMRIEELRGALSGNDAGAGDGGALRRVEPGDIEDCKRVETELRAMVERYRFANKAANDVIWDWDIIRNEQQWNEAGTAVFGWTEIVERPVSAEWWVERLHPDDRERVHESFFAVVDSPELEVWHDEYRFLKADGAYADVMDRGYVLRDEQGKAIRMIGAMQNITERKEIEEHLRETLANARVLQNEAEAANRAKSSFLANMSHEIRTPLNGVIGFLELLQDTALDRTQREYAGHIDTSARLLLNILSNVLDISKIEAERLELNFVPSDIREAVERALAPVRVLAARKNITLAARVESSVPERAVFDPVRLEQVLVNLLSNALKFTERGGVELSLRFAPRGGNAGAFTFSVKDSGIGMSPEECSRIFEPFYQSDSSDTRRYGGAGLGLSICQRLLQKMESVLDVESAPGEGSRFFFTLRLGCDASSSALSTCEAEAPREEAKRLPPVRRKENPVVMIVEDEWLNRKMLAVMVSKIAPSASVLQADDGEQAVALFRERKPDLIFMDLQMPVKDGFRASEEIRAMELENASGGDRCRIVAITADVQPETPRECIAAGMDHYLSKPVEKEEICSVLELWIGRERPEGEHAQ